MKVILVISLLIGIFITYMGILILIWKSKCNKEITGTFMKFNVYKSYSGYSVSTSYAPVFKYTYNNKEYESQTFEGFSKKIIDKFTYGKEYNIFINEKKPRKFVIDKKFRISYVFIIIFGIFFVILSLLGFLV